MPPTITKLAMVINKIQYHYNWWLYLLLLSVLLELLGIIYGEKVICVDSFYE